MATDILNTTLPNDNVNAPDTNFSNDTSLNGNEPSQLAYTEPSDGAKQLIAVDQAIIDGLYPTPDIAPSSARRSPFCPTVTAPMGCTVA